MWGFLFFILFFGYIKDSVKSDDDLIGLHIKTLLPLDLTVVCSIPEGDRALIRAIKRIGNQKGTKPFLRGGDGLKIFFLRKFKTERTIHIISNIKSPNHLIKQGRK